MSFTQINADRILVGWSASNYLHLTAGEDYTHPWFNKFDIALGPDNRMQFSIIDSIGFIRSGQTVEIRMDVPADQAHRVVFSLRWYEDNYAKCFVNNIQVPCSPSDQILSTQFVIIPTRPVSLKLLPSCDQPNAAAECKKWIDYRNANKARWEKNRPSRIIRTEDDVLNEFCDSILNVESSVQSLREGKQRVIQNLVGQLRSLIYWDEKLGTSYCPSLLRLAASRSLPLPVYYNLNGMEHGPSEGTTSVSRSSVLINVGSVLNKTENSSLMDIQEVLLQPFFEYELFTMTKPINLLFSDEKPAQLTKLEAICDLARMLGGGHSSPDITEELQKIRTAHSSGLSNFLIHAGQTIVDLGKYVAREYGRTI